MRTGDEQVLADLHNRAFAAYPGTVLRTPEYWRWACVDRPGVSPEGIIILEEGDGIEGYVVVSDDGTILEFAVDPETDRLRVALLLLESAEQRARQTAAVRLTVNVPASDDVLAEAMARRGFGPGELSRVHVTIHEYPELVRHLFETNGYRGPGLELELRAGEVAGSFAIPSPADRPAPLHLVADQRVLDRVILGASSPIRAQLTGGIHPRPWWRQLAAYRALRAMKVRGRWFHPLGDVL